MHSITVDVAAETRAVCSLCLASVLPIGQHSFSTGAQLGCRVTLRQLVPVLEVSSVRKNPRAARICAHAPAHNCEA